VADNATRVGFIGLGAMGRPMALNLLKAGREVTVYDVNPAAIETLLSAGAVAAASPAEVAKSSDFVHVIVLTEAQVETVLFGEPDGGLVANLPENGVVLVHSTISPAGSASAAERAATRSVYVLDAPVTGGIKAAEDGTLSFIVGGDEGAIARSEKLFSILGSGTIPVGASGLAQVAKLINNMLAAANSVAIAEGLELARSVGLSDASALAVINAGTGASFMSTKRDLVLEMGKHSDLIGIGYKDLMLALDEAHRNNVSLPITALATQFLAGYHTQ
jgi:3-hydroxyisobutyrate dehydrogenase-like beta-hydroxyacid dehydrogenase